MSLILLLTFILTHTFTRTQILSLSLSLFQAFVPSSVSSSSYVFCWGSRSTMGLSFWRFLNPMKRLGGMPVCSLKTILSASLSLTSLLVSPVTCCHMAILHWACAYICTHVSLNCMLLMAQWHSSIVHRVYMLIIIYMHLMNNYLTCTYV